MILHRTLPLGLAALVALPGAVRAQAVQEAPPVNVAARTTPTSLAPANELGSPVFRASQLNGLEVRTPAGESVGEIKDLVINSKNGRASYVALSVGGFLGIGEKLFAIPYNAVTFVPEERADGDATPAPRNVDDAPVTSDAEFNDVVGLLDVSKDAFANAQGFDDAHWPNMADATWRNANEKAFDAIPRRYQEGADDMADAPTVRASELVGLNVVNANNETVGEINDLIIDDADGHVRYAALSVGGFLGMGDRLFAIPLAAFTIAKDADGNLAARLPATKASFAGLDGFDQDHWPSRADKSWREKADRAFGATTPSAPQR